MLQAEKESKPDVTLIKLIGSIDEGDDFSKIIGESAGNFEIHCQGITKINSIGVKNWIRFFNGIQKTGTVIRFFGFSPALSDQYNMIQNFNCGAPVVSVLLPYRCETCKSSECIEHTADSLKSNGLHPPLASCKKCGANMDFDDIPEDYLAFLDR